jgi:hypothetical protein
VTERLSPATHAAAVALAPLALNIRGFGDIKLRLQGGEPREGALLRQLRTPPPTVLKAAGW